MPNFTIAYYVGNPPTMPTDQDRHIEDFNHWIDNLGDSVVHPGTPLGTPHVVTADGVSAHVEHKLLTGFSIIRADSLDEASNMAKQCPHLEIGTVEVSEIIDM